MTIAAQPSYPLHPRLAERERENPSNSNSEESLMICCEWEGLELMLTRTNQ